MTAAVPTKAQQLSLGNRMGVVASFTGIDDTNTWNTGMSAIEHVSITNGASGSTVGYTISGGTITFAAGGGSLANATVLVIGFA